MRPGGPPNGRPGLGPGQPQQQQQPGTPGRGRRRPDLTLLPLPQRDLTSLAVPLPLPPPPSSAPSSASSSGSGSGPPSMGAPTPPNSAGSAPPAPPPLGELERVRRIGSGAGGTVWMVRHAPTGRPYALKVLYGHHDDAVRRQITREIAILRTAEHPAIVRCHGMYEQAGELQILLEYMDGGSLEGRRIATEAFLADVARQVLSGIAYLHRRHIVHRDIKPSNLLIDSGRRVKIADFGVGRILNQTMDPCNSSVGTIAYMSPERINTDLNDGAYDGYAGDIWSFGLSILEFYLGRFPLGENLGKLGDWAALMVAICYSDSPAAPPTASPELRSFISCCLQKNPARRPSAAQLLQHKFIAGPQPQVLAPPPS
ncbi:hypothetical protein QYE76_026119 [Lolium multiflorum]|uniref:mitogen-activated protein kinase kinase n=1 Tax=Lolium multiflorum TaxID=4521 RepID=A0AAD8RGN7_LOLMU|nr:hypothetical protein QYE76_026119 [Lolium multiflorum]